MRLITSVPGVDLNALSSQIPEIEQRPDKP